MVSRDDRHSCFALRLLRTLFSAACISLRIKQHWILAFAIAQLLIANSNRLIADDTELQRLLNQYQAYSGSTIVFQRDDLTPGRYHDVMKPLSVDRRIQAVKVCLDEVQRYPPRYLGKIGLKMIGVFEACASKRDDGFHTYDAGLGGYRYFGVYNGTDAFASSFYSEGQLASTYHHEVFHHVDSTVDGITASWQLSADDAFYRGAIHGTQPYPKPTISEHDLGRLREFQIGTTLRNAVSAYAAKNPREDQAETARHLMSMTAASLIQVIDKPELPGSQRILHIIGEYEKSIADGPGLDWFLHVALQRTDNQIAKRLRTQLASLVRQDRWGRSKAREDPQLVRQRLAELALLNGESVSMELRTQLVTLAMQATRELLVQRLQPDPDQNRFVVYGDENAGGANWTLRGDVAAFRLDAARLSRIALLEPAMAGEVDRIQLSNLRLLARYYLFIRLNWRVTPGTTRVFELARDTYSRSLHVPPTSASRVQGARFSDLSRNLSSSGKWLGQ